MKSLKERLDQSRRRMLAAMLVGYALWQSANVLGNLGSALTLSAAARRMLLALGAVGWILWAAYLVRMMSFMWVLHKDKALASALNDECVRRNRLKAFAVGFWAVLVMQAAFLAVPASFPLPTAAAANLTLLVAITSATGAFLLFDRG